MSAPLFAAAACLMSSLIAIGVASTPPPASPDVVPIPPDGQRYVSRSVRIRLADPAGPWITGHRIEAGDTFEKLAATRLGAGHRADELIALNPDVDPHRMRVDGLVWVPAAAATGAAARLCYVYLSRSVRDSARAFAPSADGFDFVTTLALVAPAKRAAFEASLRDHGGPGVESVLAEGEVELVGPTLPSDLVPESSPAHRVEVDAELVMDKDGKPRVDVLSVRWLDAEGQEVEPAPGELAGEGAPRWIGWFAVGAAIVIVVLATSRRRASRIA